MLASLVFPDVNEGAFLFLCLREDFFPARTGERSLVAVTPASVAMFLFLFFCFERTAAVQHCPPFVLNGYYREGSV